MDEEIDAEALRTANKILDRRYGHCDARGHLMNNSGRCDYCHRRVNYHALGISTGRDTEVNMRSESFSAQEEIDLQKLRDREKGLMIIIDEMGLQKANLKTVLPGDSLQVPA